jgi:OmpA-OmpF porin, OOP family
VFVESQVAITPPPSTHSIAAARLKGFGVGPLAPVASNNSDDSRAKNRRVGLVKP